MTTDSDNAQQCPKCRVPMDPEGVCLLNDALKGGLPDFPGDTHAATVTAISSGNRYECVKCSKCGFSRIVSAAPRVVRP